jgi:hypothetical protein
MKAAIVCIVMTLVLLLIIAGTAIALDYTHVSFGNAEDIMSWVGTGAGLAAIAWMVAALYHLDKAR